MKITIILESEFSHNYTRSTTAIIDSALMAFFAFAVLVGPFLVAQNPHDIASFNLMDSYKPPFWSEGGDVRFLLGTDGQGRDVWASILYGARISVLLRLVVMIAGFYGGIIDQ